MYSRKDAKQRAANLRIILADLGVDIGHSQSLETIARLRGYNDWNTCVAALNRKTTLQPVPFGWMASGDHREFYDIGIDQGEVYNGHFPAVIRYRETSPVDATGFATLMQVFDAQEFKGKRAKLSCALKCEDCDGAVTLWMRGDSNTKEGIAFDNLETQDCASPNGPISGSCDWSLRQVVLDIPIETAKISFGFYLRGKGSAFAAQFTLEVVSGDVETTVENSNHAGPINLSMLAG